MKPRLDDDGVIHCPGCDGVMKRLYWKQFRDDGVFNLFSYWYGCTDCGKYIYDKHADIMLSLFREEDVVES